MNRPSKLTLAEARAQGKIDQFIAEREGDEPGDLDAVRETVNSMSQTSEEARPASSEDCGDD